MSVLARSVGNAFRNKIRTAAVVAVLAVAIGLALAMLVANQAVGAKVQELNASVGTTLTVNPAGGQGFEGGGEPLTTAEAETAASVANVTSVVGTKALRLQTATTTGTTDAATGTTQQAGPGGGFGPGGQQATVSTNLTAAVDAGTLGNRNNAERNHRYHNHPARAHPPDHRDGHRRRSGQHRQGPGDHQRHRSGRLHGIRGEGPGGHVLG